jgi:hypothetical protein
MPVFSFSKPLRLGAANSNPISLSYMPKKSSQIYGTTIPFSRDRTRLLLK